MNNLTETQIVQSEERLRLAMLHSDVNALNELLAPKLIFTNHLGQIFTKQDDLEAHRSGMIKVEMVTPSEQKIQFVGDVAIVSVLVRIVGTYADVKHDNDFRFTRLWAFSGQNWQVVAAHSSLVA